MAPSVLLYTILFTLEDKPVHKNQYIQMFLIWLSYVIKSKSLNENDTLCLIGDRYTINYLKHETPFETIAKLISCKFYLLDVEQPKTLMEGCMLKYNQLVLSDVISRINYDILIYTDIDIIINIWVRISRPSMFRNRSLLLCLYIYTETHKHTHTCVCV